MNNNDKFIMLPTNDFCFKELMQNPKIRKGFISMHCVLSGTMLSVLFFLQTHKNP